MLQDIQETPKDMYLMEHGDGSKTACFMFEDNSEIEVDITSYCIVRTCMIQQSEYVGEQFNPKNQMSFIKEDNEIIVCYRTKQEKGKLFWTVFYFIAERTKGGNLFEAYSQIEYIGLSGGERVDKLKLRSLQDRIIAHSEIPPHVL